MARRKKQASLSAELFEVFAAIVKVMLAAMVEVIKFAVQVIAWFVPNLFNGLWAVLRWIGRGIVWVFKENAREVKELDAVRRAKLEAARAWRYETADEVEEEYEVTDETVLPLLPEAVEELPPIEFRFIGSVDEVEAVEVKDDGADEWVLSTMPWDTVDKARKVLERRLKALEDRRAKAEWVNRVDEVTWTRYQNTKAWRGLLWEINHTQAQLEMLGAE
ncbi:MAG: hypothetical protein IKT43_01920 [Clostridia bacterium]|nr:hypothetical protein [Clostridia bacterium]